MLGCLALTLRNYLTVEVLVEHEIQLRAAIERHPVAAWLIGLAVYFFVSLIPGTSGKSIICGWFFGFWQAVLMVDVALTAAALSMFWFSRYLIHDAIESRFGLYLQGLNRHLKRDGPFYLLFLRMAHVPFTFVNYSSGALAIRTSTFAWTTSVGLLPGTIVFVFVGTQLPTLAELIGEGVGRLLDPWLLAALVLTGIFPLGIRWIATYFRRSAVAHGGGELTSSNL